MSKPVKYTNLKTLKISTFNFTKRVHIRSFYAVFYKRYRCDNCMLLIFCRTKTNGMISKLAYTCVISFFC